jgi:hypothetical protein
MVYLSINFLKKMKKKLTVEDLEELMGIMRNIKILKNKLVEKNNDSTRVDDLIKLFLDFYLEFYR